ncbi:MAG TPA: Flp pilus assembly protein CpaB [Azospirillum sp.]|nr:Flp pilus assembly protein CpaB [Azospirillum sp.]
MLLLACVMGGTAVFLARGWLERQNRPQMIAATPQAPVQPALTTVVVAKIPLRFGDELNRENLREVNWPSDAVPDGGFTSIDGVLSGGERRVALRDIGANEPLLKGRVSGFGGRATLSALVGPDMRAVTIRVNDVQGVAGFVLPGDRVDVIFTRPEGAAESARPQSPPIADVLLQNLKVLAVDQLADSQKDKPVPAKAITLEASTEEAQKLTLASQVGTLSLTLRNFANSNFAEAGTITVSGLLSRQLEPAPAESIAEPTAEPARALHSVRILRGIESSMQDVTPELERQPAQPPSPAKPPHDRARVAWTGAAARPTVGVP